MLHVASHCTSRCAKFVAGVDCKPYWYSSCSLTSPVPARSPDGKGYYAYATNGRGSNVQAAYSSNLAEWQIGEDALPVLPAWALPRRTWAPDVGVLPGMTSPHVAHTCEMRALLRMPTGCQWVLYPAMRSCLAPHLPASWLCPSRSWQNTRIWLPCWELLVSRKQLRHSGFVAQRVY